MLAGIKSKLVFSKGPRMARPEGWDQTLWDREPDRYSKWVTR